VFCILVKRYPVCPAVFYHATYSGNHGQTKTSAPASPARVLAFYAAHVIASGKLVMHVSHAIKLQQDVGCVNVATSMFRIVAQ